MALSDHEHVHFAEDYELNYHLHESGQVGIHHKPNHITYDGIGTQKTPKLSIPDSH